MGKVTWSQEAREDLHMIHDRVVIAEVMDLAERELTIPSSPSDIEGILSGYSEVYWRRVVKRGELQTHLAWDLRPDVDEFADAAYDYVIVYRHTTSNELINLLRRRRAWLVLRVLHNRELVRVYPGQTP